MPPDSIKPTLIHSIINKIDDMGLNIITTSLGTDKLYTNQLIKSVDGIINKYHNFIKEGFDKMHKEFRSTNHKQNTMMKFSIISTFMLLFFTQVNAQSAIKKVEIFLMHDEEIKQV